jgi:uncharacterized protein with GYD domain
MGIYLMLSTLTEKGRKVVRDDPKKIEEVNEEAERMGVQILSQYALLGSYDFMTLLKAESDEVIMRLAIELTAGGKMEVLTLPAIHIDKYLESMKK